LHDGPLKLVLLLMESNTTVSGVAQVGPPQSAKTQRGTILRLLIEARGGWVSSPEIAACAQQYNARIFELRKLGFCIENRTETVPGTGARRSWFRLINSPSVKRSRQEPPNPRSHSGGNLAQFTGLPLFDAEEP